MSKPPPRASAKAIAARRRRIAKGIRAEQAVRDAGPGIKGLQRMLAFPLLELIEREGGRARPSDIYDQLADRLSLPTGLRRATRVCAEGARRYDWFPQQVRWARQTAVMQGLIVPADRGIWELTENGHVKLGRVRRGSTYLVYSTHLGVALWAHAEDAAQHIERESVQLIFTSPVYPIATARGYGGMSPAEWLDWMRRLTRLWSGLLTPDGVIAINIADTYVPGTPTISSYLSRFRIACQDDIGLYELAPHFWHNPNKLPSLQWAAKERVDLCNSVEYILRFSKTPFPKADNRRILEPYNPTTIAKWKKGRAETHRRRSSGYDINPAAFAPTQNGAIANALIEAANSASNDAYSRSVRAQGLPLHPARFPAALPRRLIKLHTDPHQVVYDPMDGSGTTAWVAENESRRWITSDPMLGYKLGSMTRFTELPGFVRHLSPDQSAPSAAAD